ncbi:MAG: hypothetical protein WAZ48_01570, partial [Lysobacteraceae bacterium]
MIVTRALSADCDLLRLHRQAPERYPLLLQSTSSSLHADHAQSGSSTLRSSMCRWDLLLVANGEALRLDRDGQVRDQHDVVISDQSRSDQARSDDFLALLDQRWRA